MNKRVLLTCAGIMLGLLPLLSACGASADTQVTEQLVAQRDQAAGNKQVLATFLELFMTGKWDEFNTVIAEDCVLHEPGGLDVVGLEAMKGIWQVGFAPLKDMKAETIALVSEGEMLMGLYAMEASYEGEYMGKQIAGVPVKFQQAETMRIVDGKIVEWWVGIDRLWMSEQLGFQLQSK